MYFQTVTSAVLYGLFVAGLLGGLSVFGRNLFKRDQDYEKFLPWYARLSLYCFVFSPFPPVAFIVAAIMFLKKGKAQRKLAVGSLYVGVVWSCFMLSWNYGAVMV